MRSRSVLSLVGSVAGLAAVLAAWLTIGPIGFGGSTGYALVVGSSMEPRLHRGDLVLVRRTADYAIGDVVAYRSAALGRTVLHRIISVRDGRYVFKGDANSFTDPGDGAPKSDLIGRYWFKVGGAAPVLVWVRTPWHAAVLGAVLGLLLFAGGTGATVGRRGRRRRGPSGAPRAPKDPRLSPLGNIWQPAATVAGVFLLAFVCLGAVALHAAPTRVVPTNSLYSEVGRFSYAAPVPRSAAYPTGRVTGGDPVFTRLVESLGVRFDWHLGTPQPHVVHGAVAFAAEVSDGTGWRRSIVLAPRRAFAGDSVSVAGTLRLASVETLLRRFEAATGTHAGAYQITLVPSVELAGSVAGQVVVETFAPPLRFTLDEFRLQLVASTDPSQPNGLLRSSDAPGTVAGPNQLSFAGRDLALPTARRAALVGSTLSLLVLLLALAAQRRFRPADGMARIRERHGSSIVRVVGDPVADRLVTVASFEELALLAERYDRLIMHNEHSGAFQVEDDGIAYRWLEEREGAVTRPWSLPTEPDEERATAVNGS